tara:strand:+ start:352 stop:948 length:597 start_codon:yes stop_codon:yes gene_type:complete
MKKFLLLFLIILIWNKPSYSKDLFEYLKSNQPPPLILGHIDFNKALNKEISNLSIYLGMSKNKQPLNETFYSTLINGSASHDEININNKKFFIVSGCRPRSCPEKGLLWIDKKKKIVIGAMIHYFIDSRDNRNQEGNLLIFSNKFISYKKVPKKFKEDLNSWISILTSWDFENNNPNKPLRPTIRRFINSNNEIKTIE